MKNNLYEEFAEEKFNKDNNYNAIISKIQEGSPMKKNRSKKYKILNIAAIFLAVIIVGSATQFIYAKIQWDIKFKEYQNREYETGSGRIKETIESGYNEEVEMDYIVQDNISIKIDSLIITDDYFEAKINFKFSDEIQLNSETFSYGFAVYDDKKNVYGVSARMHIGSNEKRDYYTPYMYKEIGVKYNKNDIYAIQLMDGMGIERVRVNENDRNIITKITLNSTKGFPRSKKLYIRVFDLGYYMMDIDNNNLEYTINSAENFTLSDAEWIFEINVPDKFYERQTTELKLKDAIPGVEIEKIAVTEVGLVVRAKIEGINDIITLGKDITTEEWKKLRNETVNITDEDGTIYYENSMGTLQEKDWIKLTYEINKNMLNKKLFLNVKINGQQYTSELIEK